MDDRSREFSKRYAARMGKPPSMMQAGVYSSVLNHIKSIQAANTKDPAAIVKDLQGRTFNDAFARNGKLRADNLMEISAAVPAGSFGIADGARIVVANLYIES